MAKLCFFVGKGGVGKTTVSAAYAVREAMAHPRSKVLLLSADPAHSLGDIFQQQFGDRPERVKLPGRGHLRVWEVNAEREFRSFLDAHKEQMLEVLESGSSLFTREDIEPLLDTALPGMAEMSALLAVHQALQSGENETIAVDTAPFGHTLRLFEMPEQFARLLEFLDLARGRDRVLAAHFGGHARPVGAKLLAEWRAMAEAVKRTLAHESEVILVTTPERFAINESIRCGAILRAQEPRIEITAVVLNRAMSGKPSCAACSRRQKMTSQARIALRQAWRGITILSANDSPAPVLGPAALAAFGEHVFGGKALRLRTAPPAAPEVRMVASKWPALKSPLTLVLGKGGVGKTTVSAAMGFHARARSKSTAVQICSVDPAPSLDDVFQTEVGHEPAAVLGDPKYMASEVDSVALFRQWAEQMRRLIGEATTTEQAGIHLDLSFEHQLLSQLLEIVPPGVDEMLAVFRILELAQQPGSRVVIDMAPTGHALELLRTPERMMAWTRLLLKTLARHRTLAFARDMGLKIAEMANGMRDLRSRLSASRQAQFHVVMLAETLPDRETERLIHELRRLGMPPSSVFVNRVIFASGDSTCKRCAAAAGWQRHTLARLSCNMKEQTVHVVRNFPREIAGPAALREFTRELWKLS